MISKSQDQAGIQREEKLKVGEKVKNERLYKTHKGIVGKQRRDLERSGWIYEIRAGRGSGPTFAMDLSCVDDFSKFTGENRNSVG